MKNRKQVSSGNIGEGDENLSKQERAQRAMYNRSKKVDH